MILDILEETKAKLVFVDNNFLQFLSEQRNNLNTCNIFGLTFLDSIIANNLFNSNLVDFDYINISELDIASINYTSCSTGGSQKYYGNSSELLFKRFGGGYTCKIRP